MKHLFLLELASAVASVCRCNTGLEFRQPNYALHSSLGYNKAALKATSRLKANIMNVRTFSQYIL